MSRIKPLCNLLVFAGMVGAVQATCWQIHWSSTHHFGGVGGPCLSGCDDVFPHIYPGGNCAGPASTGSKQVVCFPGTTGVNPDGTVFCQGSGIPTLATVPSGMECQVPCRQPIPQ